MKHQIALVGGQLAPVYLGIKELQPNAVHFIVSKESSGRLSGMKSLLPKATKSNEYKCDPFDFISIKSVCESIIQSINDGDTVTFNLTGGTKIMVLACHALIIERGLNGIYINQDYSLLELPSYNKRPLMAQLSIDEFFGLSGHKVSSSQKLGDFNSSDFAAAGAIQAFASLDKRYTSILNSIRTKYDNNVNPMPLNGFEKIQKDLEVSWDTNSVSIIQKGKSILKVNSRHAKRLFFNGAWWELLVAKEVSKWVGHTELLLNCQLPFRTDQLTNKNEIDILINTGSRLIFIECKSGKVRQEDVNKMRVIKETYGGLISQSILVCRFIPLATIQEKCKELDIEVFYTHSYFKVQQTQLNKIVQLLKTIESKGSL